LNEFELVKRLKSGEEKAFKEFLSIIMREFLTMFSEGLR